MIRLIEKLGRKTLDFIAELGEISLLQFRILLAFPKVIKNRKQVLFQMEHIGVGSLPLVLIIAVSKGIPIELIPLVIK